MALDKQQQFQLAQMDLWNHRIGVILEFVKAICWMGCILGCVFMVFESLKAMVVANPAGINAIALVVKNLGLGSKMSYLVSAASGGAWYIERKSRKRLLVEVANYRRGKEANDPYKSPSGLTSSGDTPSKKRGK